MALILWGVGQSALISVCLIVQWSFCSSYGCLVTMFIFGPISHHHSGVSGLLLDDLQFNALLRPIRVHRRSQHTTKSTDEATPIRRGFVVAAKPRGGIRILPQAPRSTAGGRWHSVLSGSLGLIGGIRLEYFQCFRCSYFL